MERAFPPALAAGVQHARAHLSRGTSAPSGTIQGDARVWGEIHADGQELRIPNRHYDAPLTPPEAGSDAAAVWAAWFTRHGDGGLRQRCARDLMAGASSVWAVAYLTQLLGEYVLDICTDIADFVTEVVVRDAGWRDAFVRFWHENPGFVRLTRNRAESYWKVYYRRWTTLEAYPSLRALRVIDDLVAPA